MRFSDGTPAPWEPTQKIVVRGPYRYIRNPMITGALLILSAQAMLFQSLPIALWMIVFLIFNLIYFPKVEEPRMLKRFSDLTKVSLSALFAFPRSQTMRTKE